jgi:NTE family protein
MKKVSEDKEVSTPGRAQSRQQVPDQSPVRLNLALQGGGGHGAFTWGVLDRLLEDDRVAIGDISGTSAGALNGAALVTGFARGGRDGARENLALLWRQVTEAGALMSMLQVPLKKPGLGVWDDVLPVLSPYQTNPLALEPLKYILTTTVDIALMQASKAPGPTLSVNAVNLNNGHTRVFGPAEMSIPAIMASACAPFMFQAVQIEGESYWDGSYGSNPVLWPLYEGKGDVDILLVELTPLQRPETPTTAKNILNRINEIAAIGGMVSELRLMDSVTSHSGQAVRMHIISLPDTLARADAEPSTKRTVDAALFQTLRQQGRQACADWLESNRNSLGIRSSGDVRNRYVSPYEPRSLADDRVIPR